MNDHVRSVSLGVLVALSAFLSACAGQPAQRAQSIDVFVPMWSYSRPVPAFWWYTKMQIDAMHVKGKAGDKRTVAILDSGFMDKQPDVNPSRIDAGAAESCSASPTKNFDDFNGHGTAMGVIALGDDKGAKPGGIATKSKLLPIKVVCGVSTSDSVVNGVDIAVAAKADVILLALGSWPSDVDVNNKTVHDRLLGKVQAAMTISPAPLFVVASVWDNATYKFPIWTTQPNVILVAAMTLDAALAEVLYSEQSGHIWAPGRDIETAFIDYGDPNYPGKYPGYLLQGTSAAAAIVAGCAAAIKDDGEKGADLKTRLTTKFVDTTTLPGSRGRLDCFKGL